MRGSFPLSSIRTGRHIDQGPSFSKRNSIDSTLQKIRPTLYSVSLAATDLFRQLALGGAKTNAHVSAALQRELDPEDAYLDDFLPRCHELFTSPNPTPEQRIEAAVLEASVFLFASASAWLEAIAPAAPTGRPQLARGAIDDVICAVAIDAYMIEQSDRRLGEIIDDVRMNHIVASLGVPEATIVKYPDLFREEERPPEFPGSDFYTAIAANAFLTECVAEPLDLPHSERLAFAEAWEDAQSLAHVVFHDRFAGRTTPINDLPLSRPLD